MMNKFIYIYIEIYTTFIIFLNLLLTICQYSKDNSLTRVGQLPNFERIERVVCIFSKENQSI